MKKYLSLLTSLVLTHFAFSQQYAGTGNGKLTFGEANSLQEYSSKSIYSNMSFDANSISFHFKTSTFSPVNNSDPNLVGEVFDSGLKSAMEFVGKLPAEVEKLKLKESISVILKAQIAYGSVKKPIDLPIKIKRIGETKYQFSSDGVLSLQSLGINPGSPLWKKTSGKARLKVNMDMHSEF